MRSPLRLWGKRVTSWFRKVVLPSHTEPAEIREAEERPWLEEQMRTWASNVPRRWTPLSESMTAETAEMRVAYREALAEPMVKASLLTKIGQVIFQDLQCTPENKKDPLEIECAQFVKSQLIGPSGTFHEIGWPIASGMLIDGFSVCEKLPGTVERGKFAGRWGLKGIKAKDTKRLQIETDTYRNVTGIWSTVGNAGTFFDPNDFVVASWLKFFENPMGMSDLRAVYRAVKMIVHAMKLRIIFLDKYTGPYLKGRYKDASRRAKMREALTAARSNGFIMLSEGDDVEVIDLATRGTSDFQSAIDDLRKEIAIGITNSFLTMLTGGGPEQRGNSEVQKDSAEIGAELLSVHIISVVNTQIVPDLVIPNYGTRIAFPRVSLSAIDPSLILKELEIDKALQDLGGKLSASEVYDRCGRSPAKDANDVLEPRQQPGIGLPGAPSMFAGLDGDTSEFSGDQIAEFGRAGLVRKRIINSLGHEQTVWVKGQSAIEATNKPKASPPTTAPAAHVAVKNLLQRLLAHAGKVPVAVRAKVSKFVAGTYKKLQGKYGNTGAKLVLAGMILLSPTPIPGSSLIPIALAEGVKRIAGLFRAGESEFAGEGIDVATLAAEIRQALAELYAAAGEPPPAIDDAEIQRIASELADSGDLSEFVEGSPATGATFPG